MELLYIYLTHGYTIPGSSNVYKVRSKEFLDCMTDTWSRRVLSLEVNYFRVVLSPKTISDSLAQGSC
jgi:hypothetical protein